MEMDYDQPHEKQVRLLTRELVDYAFDKVGPTCNCDEEAGQHCIVDVAYQLCAELDLDEIELLKIGR
jgi:hypothetical protein